MPILEALGLAVLGVIGLSRRLVGWTYLFQLDEYLPSRLAATWRRRMAAGPLMPAVLLLAEVALGIAALLVASSWRAIPLAVAAVLPAALHPPFAERSRLRWTGRARRLFSLAAVVGLGVLLLAFWQGPAGAFLVGLADLLCALALGLAALTATPYERRQRRHFMRTAEERLRMQGPTVVGITGSYGKTTTKVLLAQLLDDPEGSAFATPASYNTTLGVCRAINEGLGPAHRVAVLEMGAYRPGEIAEICSFTHPTIGVVTAIGPMHLERFGTRQRIAVAKSELLAALPAEGVAVIPSGIAERETLLTPLRARLVEVGGEGDRWWFESTETVGFATVCRLRGSAGEQVDLRVPLFGRHLLSDLLCALAVAAELGHPPDALRERVAGLKGAPHRLEVTRQGEITIIDDAYNSNPEGALEALRLLGELPGQRRVLVTPGYVELGAEQEGSMLNLGRAASEVCTHVILVGPRHSAPVARGLSQAGYPERQVSVVSDLREAEAVLPRVAGPGSVVLFENDLPDQYMERR